MYKGKLYSKILVAGIFLSILVLLSNGYGTEVILEQKKNNLGPVDFDYNLEKPLFLDLIPSEPIEISSDGDFISQGFNGSGTAGDPYIIENYNIITTSGTGISIFSTTKYFVIRNCYITGFFGIFIQSVAEGTATILNNTCSNSMNDGIRLFYSSGATFINNTCTKNREGIRLFYSSGATLINNTFTKNRGGINIGSSSSCLVTYNLLYENEEYGITIFRYADDNFIHHNIFVDNNFEHDSQATDSGKGNKWYDTETKEGNYWSDLGSQCTYKIDGKAHSKDLYPLNRALDCLNPIIISTISIVLPILGSVAILAFVVPRYIIPYTRKILIPYFRKRRAEKQLRRAKILSCPKCSKSIKTSTTSCENCGTTIPKRKLFANLSLKIAESKLNKVIILVYIGMILLAIPVVILWYSFSLYGGYDSYAWMFYLMFFIAPGIPLAIIILLILFKAEIARMKLWAKLSLLCCIILVLAGIIYGGFMGWVLTFHFS